MQAILASRIDRLPSDAKDLLQTLAVIGREFPIGLIKGVIQRSSDEELERMLDVLQLGEFIYEQPSFSESAYIFKHALTQEVAYGSMLVKRRKELHEATARQIEALFNSHLEDHYAALAHHYGCSGNSLKALEYLQLAAQQAMQRSANAEAISQLNAAMQFLNTLPETPQRDRQELALQTMLGPALIATKGNGAPEVGAVYQRAVQLGRLSGEDARLFPVLFGLRSFHLIRGELQPAFALGQQLLSLAENARDSGLLVEAHLALGNSLFLFGKLAPVFEALRAGHRPIRSEDTSRSCTDLWAGSRRLLPHQIWRGCWSFSAIRTKLKGRWRTLLRWLIDSPTRLAWQLPLCTCCNLLPSQRVAKATGASGDGDRALHGAGIRSHSCTGKNLPRVRTCSAGTNRRRNCRVSRRFRRSTRHRGDPVPTLVSSFTRRRPMERQDALRKHWTP